MGTVVGYVLSARSNAVCEIDRGELNVSGSKPVAVSA